MNNVFIWSILIIFLVFNIIAKAETTCKDHSDCDPCFECSKETNTCISVKPYSDPHNHCKDVCGVYSICGKDNFCILTSIPTCECDYISNQCINLEPQNSELQPSIVEVNNTTKPIQEITVNNNTKPIQEIIIDNNNNNNNIHFPKVYIYVILCLLSIAIFIGLAIIIKLRKHARQPKIVDYTPILISTNSN